MQSRFDLGLPAELGVGRHDGELFGVFVLGVEGGADFFPLGEERAEVDDEVFRDGQAGERFDRDRFGVERFHAGLAGEAGHPVDAHRAGAAHADAAGAAEGKRRVVLALDDEQGVEDGHPAVEVEREELFRVRVGARELDPVRGHIPLLQSVAGVWSRVTSRTMVR